MEPFDVRLNSAGVEAWAGHTYYQPARRSLGTTTRPTHGLRTPAREMATLSATGCCRD